jgi:FKBP-type peptidyl-prolyl cis-trans isomerase
MKNFCFLILSFLTLCLNAEDTLSLKSGEILIRKTKNTGVSPAYGDYVKVHYKAFYKEEEFDNSYKRNAALALILGTRRIPASWDSAITIMHQGEEIEIQVPAKLLSSTFRPESNMDDNEIITYHLKLVSLLSCKYDKPFSGWRKDTLNLPSGIKMIVIEFGDNSKKPKAGDLVTVQYAGYLTNGTKFDASYGTFTPFNFTLGNGQVIQGWDEVVSLMGKGMKVKVIIPPELAYGEVGIPQIIPPNETLVFDIQLLDYY